MGGALRLIFAVSPQPSDRDWFGCFDSHLNDAGLSGAEVIDDGSDTVVTVSVNPLDAAPAVDALAEAMETTDREYREVIAPARRAAEEEARLMKERVAAAIEDLDRRLRVRFPR
jgi:hypothetical protein